MMQIKRIKDDKGVFLKITAPQQLSFTEFPEQTINFYSAAEELFRKNENVIYDLSKVIRVSCDAIGVLVSQIKDRNITRGRLNKIIFPDDTESKRRIKKWSIFKKVDNVYYCGADEDCVTKVTDYNVANELAKEMCMSASIHVFGKIVRIKELYEVLIECMANTDDHAAAGEDVKYRWWVFFSVHDEVVNIVFVDMGVGIFESLPVRQHITTKIVRSISGVFGGEKIGRVSEVNTVFNALINGEIKSRTGLRERGKGIPLIERHSKSRIFDSFYLIANDVFVDMKENKVSTMSENFSGTMICLQLRAIEA